MGVGLVRSLQPPDILWIHWRVYNSIANTSKGGTLLPPSDAYVGSFLYLLYTLIKLYDTHTHTHTKETQEPSKKYSWLSTTPRFLWKSLVKDFSIKRKASFLSQLIKILLGSVR